LNERGLLRHRGAAWGPLAAARFRTNNDGGPDMVHDESGIDMVGEAVELPEQ
jgi:hypothetical protein